MNKNNTTFYVQRNGLTFVDIFVILSLIAILVVLIIPTVQRTHFVIYAQEQEAKNVVCTKTFEYQKYREHEILIAVFNDDGKLMSLICSPSIYAKINKDTKYNIKYKKYIGTDTDGQLMEAVAID